MVPRFSTGAGVRICRSISLLSPSQSVTYPLVRTVNVYVSANTGSRSPLHRTEK